MRVPLETEAWRQRCECLCPSSGRVSRQTNAGGAGGLEGPLTHRAPPPGWAPAPRSCLITLLPPGWRFSAEQLEDLALADLCNFPLESMLAQHKEQFSQVVGAGG